MCRFSCSFLPFLCPLLSLSLSHNINHRMPVCPVRPSAIRRRALSKCSSRRRRPARCFATMTNRRPRRRPPRRLRAPTITLPPRRRRPRPPQMTAASRPRRPLTHPRPPRLHSPFPPHYRPPCRSSSSWSSTSSSSCGSGSFTRTKRRRRGRPFARATDCARTARRPTPSGCR